jgi:hypothetical protein
MFALELEISLKHRHPELKKLFFRASLQKLGLFLVPRGVVGVTALVNSGEARTLFLFTPS